MIMGGLTIFGGRLIDPVRTRLGCSRTRLEKGPKDCPGPSPPKPSTPTTLYFGSQRTSTKGRGPLQLPPPSLPSSLYPVSLFTGLGSVPTLVESVTPASHGLGGPRTLLSLPQSPPLLERPDLTSGTEGPETDTPPPDVKPVDTESDPTRPRTGPVREWGTGTDSGLPPSHLGPSGVGSRGPSRGPGVGRTEVPKPVHLDRLPGPTRGGCGAGRDVWSEARSRWT